MLWHCCLQRIYIFVCIVFHLDWKITSVKLLIHPLLTGQAHIKQTAVQQDRVPAWVPSINSSFGKDTYHYVGQDIVIHESIDSFGAVMWPGVSTSENITKMHITLPVIVRGLYLSCRRWLCAPSWTTTGKGCTCRERRFWSWEQEQD